MKEMKAKAKDVAQLLKVMANEHRLLILCDLVSSPKTVTQLVQQLDISQSGVSQHLTVLKSNGIVDFEKNAQTITYCIKDKKMLEIMALLKDLYC